MTHLNVAVRVRPLSERETKVKAVPVVEIVNSNVVAVTNLKVLEHNAGDSRERVRRFSFDYCFDRNTTQQQVFEAVENVIGGAIRNRYHTCVLAYGQSSSGKTHTIMGIDDDPGLTPRLCEIVFNYVQEVDVEEEAKSITVSYLEIYNEKVKDLLSSDDRQNSLRVREHPSRGTYVQGLTHHAVNDSTALLERLQTGNKKRRVSATSVNHRSSRSHSVFTITCFGGVKLTLVDLAGSERTGSRNFNNTSTFREGANINKSLVALGNVIFALADQSKSTRKRYVPYRDSVLTWLLKDTLGGNSKTVMIATISPSHTCYNETVNTLRFGHRAKQIIAQPVSNEDPKQKTIRDLKAEVARLKDLLSNHEIDPHLQFRTLENGEVSRTLKTIDQSTNTEEPRLDENLQLTRKILDGLLEQIKAKLNDDFRWCKEELLRNSGGEGVFGEIIKKTFGKKLVCKEYSTNVTQIYNVPEFKVFVYSDGKNIPSITGVEQNVIQSFNNCPPVAEVTEQNTLENPNIVHQGLTSINLVGLNGSNVDEVDQSALKVISNFESSAIVADNINPASRFITNIDSVGQDNPRGSPNEVSCNQGVVDDQLINEALVKTEQIGPAKNVTTSVASIGQNIIKGDIQAVSVKKAAATKQLIKDGIPIIKVTNDVPTSSVDTTESCTSAVPVIQGVTSSSLAKEKLDQKVTLNVNSTKRDVTNAEPISQGVGSYGSAVQGVKEGGAIAILADQESTNIQLIDKNNTEANQNKLEVILDNKGVTNVGSVSQDLSKVSLVAHKDLKEGGATSILVKEGAVGAQLFNANADEIDSSSPKVISYVSSSKPLITQTGSASNINFVAQDITEGDTSTPLVTQGYTRLQLVHHNVEKLDQINQKGIPYVNSYKEGVSSTGLDGADVTNVDSFIPEVTKGDNIAVPVNQSNASIENVNKLDQSSLKSIPFVDLSRKVITQIGSVTQRDTNINSIVQNIAKVGGDAEQVTPELGHITKGVTIINSLVQNIAKGDTNVNQLTSELKDTPTDITNINSLAQNIAKGGANARQVTPELRNPPKGITNIYSIVQNIAKVGINAEHVTPQLRHAPTGITNINSLVQNIAEARINAPELANTTERITTTEQLVLKDAPLDLEGPKLNTATKRLDLKVLRAATDKLIPVMDVSSAVTSSEKPVVKLRRTFSVCSADMESKKTKMYGSYETLSKYQQQPEPQLRKRSLDKSSSSVRNLKASTESVPEKVKSANDVTKTFSKVEAKVDSIRKTPTKPRAEIVAAVTQRLYTKIKKREIATETDDIVKEHKGTLARIRLQDITQRALRACRRRHAESQTEALPILRVKETATDVQDLKIDAVEMKHAHVSTQEVITKDVAINHVQDATFDQPSGQSLVMTKSCGVQVSASPPTSSSKEDQQHLLSFTKYLRAQKEPKIEVSNRATANPIYTSSVNINVSHNYINRNDSVSGDSLEDQNNTNAVSLPTPDLISNHSSLEAEKAALGVPQTCVVNEERCRSLPSYQPKTYKLRVTETKPHETSFSIEQPTILKSIVKQSNDPDQSDCASDCSDNPSSHAFENVPDSLNYHFNKSVRFDEEPVNGRILEVMTNFLKEATNLMTNLAAAATNKLDADHAYDLQVTVSDAGGNVINRKPRRRPRRRRPRRNESASQTCSNYECGNYEHAVSQTSPKKTSEKSVETDGEVPENKYESLVRKACDRLERCADAISADWYGPVQPEDSSMESNVTFSDYGSLPRQKLKYKQSGSPRAFLKELTSMRRQIIDSSREELISGSHQNCG